MAAGDEITIVALLAVAVILLIAFLRS